ncbi:MAG TPA: hypothetical protein VLA46_13880 [Saprospiraceae bacterium]|nr:hypothetical protein [Saprospiraceae bacterium]
MSSPTTTQLAMPLDGVFAASYPHAVVGVLTNNHPKPPPSP